MTSVFEYLDLYRVTSLVVPAMPGPEASATDSSSSSSLHIQAWPRNLRTSTPRALRKTCASRVEGLH